MNSKKAVGLVNGTYNDVAVVTNNNTVLGLANGSAKIPLISPIEIKSNSSITFTTLSGSGNATLIIYWLEGSYIEIPGTTIPHYFSSTYIGYHIEYIGVRFQYNNSKTIEIALTIDNERVF